MAMIKKLDKKVDQRGWVVEVFKSETTGIPNFGLVFVTAASPGYLKGNHYHRHKREWLCAIEGRGDLTLVDVASKRRETIEIGEENLQVVEIEPGVAHGFKNTGDKTLVVMEYVTKAFDPDNPDTYPYDVIP